MRGDGYNITQPAPEHEGGFRVMKNAVHDAKIQPTDIGYVNAHGTSTPIGDTLEAHAIRNFFGDHKIAVSSTKSMTGHLLAVLEASKPALLCSPCATRFSLRLLISRIKTPAPATCTLSLTTRARLLSNTLCRTRSDLGGRTERCCLEGGATREIPLFVTFFKMNGCLGRAPRRVLSSNT